ncbi:MAG: hypothetical protein KF784_03205 [Fimbriimonadaceae bacterium]|nr:hypothetical protein [Fimbriimonadaceae bacterium]
MPRTLLVGSPNVSWRQWIVDAAPSPNVLCLDPADTDFGLPARLTLFTGEKVVKWRFFGGLSALRSPNSLLVSLNELLQDTPEDLTIQLFPYRPSPLLRQLTLQIAQILQPKHVLITDDLAIDTRGWPVGPEVIPAPKGYPPMVRHAQRKARWLKLLEDCEPHQLRMRDIAIEGARLGSGTELDRAQYGKLSLDNAHRIEVCGTSLLVITDEYPNDGQIARALDITHCSKAHVVNTSSYENLVCTFADDSGAEFGFGMIEKLDFKAEIARIRATAEPGTPVRLLKLGGLKVDLEGRELGEAKPWEV